ncbi:2-amino-4-hydroxy-6-hydroxymethyldihydropteridine diphosphokinase [Secundilactobacillus silagei]|uniref:2-amino-4-hydroxy-6- hydroxymethyldihydropteridine diphosphokinase n=1 Tax=Secundilactobacillus silagei TaxID=1293415 RepID=UPI0006CF7686|nr:2-amino-4-hydroxy-6-hydroxymethyldihydropteridine diphosphokinase [Secundilactobacillus silagei]
MSEQVYLSIGSNIGDRIVNLTQAVKLLQENTSVKIQAVSSVYETQPWGNLDQANFYNIAVSITTTLTPQRLLDVLHDIEQAGHRRRLQHWGPRTIDLDIVYWGNRQINTATLTVPHPHAHERNFVLLPVQEIAGDDPQVKPQVDAAWQKRQIQVGSKKVEGVTIV